MDQSNSPAAMMRNWYQAQWWMRARRNRAPTLRHPRAGCTAPHDGICGRAAQIAQVVDASSSQSHADVLVILVSTVLLLTGLSWVFTRCADCASSGRELLAVARRRPRHSGVRRTAADGAVLALAQAEGGGAGGAGRAQHIIPGSFAAAGRSRRVAVVSGVARSLRVLYLVPFLCRAQPPSCNGD